MGNRCSKNLSKNKNIIIILLAIIVVILLSFLFTRNRNQNRDLKVNINGENYYLEIAKTNKEREKGLSGRQSLCSNCGMLFIFPKPKILSFWMKNTYIPLDIIWLDKNYKIIHIATVLETNSQNTYSSKDKAKYVIELNANEVFKRDLKIGDIITIPALNE